MKMILTAIMVIANMNMQKRFACEKPKLGFYSFILSMRSHTTLCNHFWWVMHKFNTLFSIIKLTHILHNIGNTHCMVNSPHKDTKNWITGPEHSLLLVLGLKVFLHFTFRGSSRHPVTKPSYHKLCNCYS